MGFFMLGPEVDSFLPERVMLVPITGLIMFVSGNVADATAGKT